MPLGSVQFGQGFFSGLDFRAIIDAVLNAERVPIKSLKARIDTFEKAKSSFSKFSGLLDDFTSKLDGLNTSAQVAGKTASLSDSNAPFTASAGSDAAAGSYDIDVAQIAQAHRIRSDGMTDRYSPLVSDGTITVQAGGHEAITVDVSAANGNNSLQAVADEINNADEGVIATIVNDGTYDVLVLRSEESGTSHAMTVTDGTNLNLDEAANEIQAAQNASLTIDGIAITSQSNRITSAIQGVTLDLSGATTSTVGLTVGEDVETAKKSLQDFVDAYNEVNDYFDQQFGTAEFRQTSAVAGSSTVRSVQLELQGIVTGSVTGIADGKLSSLSELGITIADETGRLEFQSSKFDDLVSDGRFDEVQAVMMSTGSTTDSAVRFDSSSRHTVAGTYAVTVTQAAEQANVAGSTAVQAGGISQNETLTIELNTASTTVDLAAADTIDDIVTKINAALSNAGMAATAYSSSGILSIRANDYGDDYTIRATSDVADNGDGASTGIGTTQLTDTGIDVAGSIGGEIAQGIGQQLSGADDTDMDGLIVTVYATAASIAAKGGDFGTIGVSRGVLDAFADKIDGITDPFDGTIKSITDSYDDSIEVAQTRIDAMEQRLTRREELMVRQFSAAEQAIAQLQQLQQSLGAVTSG